MIRTENERTAEFYGVLEARTRQVLRAKGWTTAKAAEVAGISPQTLWNLLYRKNAPTSQTVRNICAAWGVSADWLMGLADEGGPDANTERERMHDNENETTE